MNGSWQLQQQVPMHKMALDGSEGGGSHIPGSGQPTDAQIQHMIQQQQMMQQQQHLQEREPRPSTGLLDGLENLAGACEWQH